jgi:hypothetical protein
MQPLRKNMIRSLLLGSLLAGMSACGNEPVKRAEELPKGRIPQMSEQQIEDSNKKQQSGGKKQSTSTQPKYIGGMKQPTVSTKQQTSDRRHQDKTSKKQDVDD